MVLTAPRLDDRSFQDLVDDAKRLVQQRCPEWSDHNVADPGVALIETFAMMIDQLFYRLNQVPERHYLRFLDLLGVKLHPPAPAVAPVTFELAKALEPDAEALIIPRGTEVATRRTETTDALSFHTVADLRLAPAHFQALVLESAGQREDVSGRINRVGDAVSVFAGADTAGNPDPVPGDAFLIGLRNPVPNTFVRLHLECTPHGSGIDTRQPPYEWQAWNGSDFVTCEVEADTTRGLNTSGEITLHVDVARTAQVERIKGGWLRCRAIAAKSGVFFNRSPVVSSISVETIGGTVEAVNAVVVEEDDLGTSDGTSGQTFQGSVKPLLVLPQFGGDVRLEVGQLRQSVTSDNLAEVVWEPWKRVTSFARSGPTDLHWVLDEQTADIHFGPATREPDGSLRRRGEVPPEGARIRLVDCRAGGGPDGNVAAGRIEVKKSVRPEIRTVRNRRPAVGGSAGEGVEEAKLRGPIALRSDRAVTVEDYQFLAREAAPGLIGRVDCLAASSPDEAGLVRVLVARSAGPRPETATAYRVPNAAKSRIEAYLEARRMLGVTVAVDEPGFVGVTVTGTVLGAAFADPNALADDAEQALYEFFHPNTGGPSGRGWRLGRSFDVAEIAALLRTVPGVENIVSLELFGGDAITLERSGQVTRIDLDPKQLPFSIGHKIEVQVQ